MAQSNADRYRDFVSEQVKALGSLDFDGNVLVWHYTNGEGLIGIVESGTLYSTQVSCLNDSTEVRYGQTIFKKALTDVLSKYEGNDTVKKFLTKYLKLLEEDPRMPSHAPSAFFIACFSSEEDNLSQWRAYCNGVNGYAIAFKASNLYGAPNSVLVKVNYDKALHEKLAATVAEATVKFYEEGLPGKSPDQIEKWEDEFLMEWDSRISYLAPLVKDPGFGAENEHRVLHEFSAGDLRQTVVVQKKTMMTRHVPVWFPRGVEAWVPRLPIEKVMVGPCRHPGITGISVDTLLRKMGYGTGKVVHSVRPFQET
jgi:Protein of unknown function (DUF2971)